MAGSQKNKIHENEKYRTNGSHPRGDGEDLREGRDGVQSFRRYITGVTLELKPGKGIVQAWRSRDCAEGHYSIVTFALAKKSGAAATAAGLEMK
jgi:hypothetical protein